jgi:hypothetical protein
MSEEHLWVASYNSDEVLEIVNELLVFHFPLGDIIRIFVFVLLFCPLVNDNGLIMAQNDIDDDILVIEALLSALEYALVKL